MIFLAQIVTWINVITNALAKFLLAPIGSLDGWLSNTIVSAVVGVILLMIFKYTSNQRAIGKVRNSIKANMLSLKLFKDSLSVTFQAQGQIFKGALLLLIHAIRPMLVMIVPVSLLLAQLGLWYQYRPLQPGEQCLVVMELNYRPSTILPKVNIVPAAGEQGLSVGVIDTSASTILPEVNLVATSAFEVTTGPVTVLSKKQIYWKIKAKENGYHKIAFQVDQQQVEKELAIGNGFMRLSSQRPGPNWSDILLHPLEKPFGSDSLVKSISVDYPDRLSQTSGTDWWMIYFFVASMVFALIFKPFLKVKI